MNDYQHFKMTKYYGLSTRDIVHACLIILKGAQSYNETTLDTISIQILSLKMSLHNEQVLMSLINVQKFRDNRVYFLLPSIEFPMKGWSN